MRSNSYPNFLKTMKPPQPKQPDLLTFKEYLRCLMPQIDTHAKRQKRYFDYLQSIPTSTKLPNGKLAVIGLITLESARELLAEEKARTYRKGDMDFYRGMFNRWWQDRLSTTRSRLGREGIRKKRAKKKLGRTSKR
jgi:hypothetical protein